MGLQLLGLGDAERGLRRDLCSHKRTSERCIAWKGIETSSEKQPVKLPRGISHHLRFCHLSLCRLQPSLALFANMGRARMAPRLCCPHGRSERAPHWLDAVISAWSQDCLLRCQGAKTHRKQGQSLARFRNFGASLSSPEVYNAVLDACEKGLQAL